MDTHSFTRRSSLHAATARSIPHHGLSLSFLSISPFVATTPTLILDNWTFGLDRFHVSLDTRIPRCSRLFCLATPPLPEQTQVP
jgi:hypothetical protein